MSNAKDVVAILGSATGLGSGIITWSDVNVSVVSSNISSSANGRFVGMWARQGTGAP